MKLYITHCTSEKDSLYKENNEKVAPELLYVGKRIQRFINNCKKKNVKWAIFSDYYGVWFPDEKHEWYEKHPKCVTPSDFESLISSSKKKLENYEVYFHGNYKSHYFHPLYKKLVDRLSKEGINIKLISKFEEIE
jgi:hypothetical protein